MAVAIVFSANVAEAQDDVAWVFTSVTVEPGKCIVKGYFYNNTDNDINITRLHIFGKVAGVRINSNFDANFFKNKPAVVSATNWQEWTFTTYDKAFTTANDHPSWHLNHRLMFENR